MSEKQNWLKKYLTGTNAQEKLPYLQKGLELDPTTDNKFRETLFKKRYLDQNGNITGMDYFLRQWMELMLQYSKGKSVFGNRGKKKKAEIICKELMLKEKLGESEKQVLLEELTNVIAVYIDLGIKDKNYGSLLLGYGRIDDDALKLKIAQDLIKGAIVFPESVNMDEEYAILGRAAKEAYIACFPFDEAIWEKAFAALH